MPLSTGRIGITQADAIYEYVPPGVAEVTPSGPTVTYGPWQDITSGDTITLNGIYQFGDVTIEATEDGTYRTVTIT